MQGYIIFVSFLLFVHVSNDYLLFGINIAFLVFSFAYDIIDQYIQALLIKKVLLYNYMM